MLKSGEVAGGTAHHRDADELAERVIAHVGSKIALAVPLGLGKPNHFVNALYRRAVADPSLHLKILTALTLERPQGASDLEQRFLGPLADRLYGDYPDLDYVKAQMTGTLPANIEICEFYLRPGAMLNNGQAQQNYISSNYTHSARDILAQGANVVAQLVGARDMPGGTRYSLSSNTDTVFDLEPRLRARAQAGEKIAVVAEVNRQLPFMEGEADVGADYFDHVLDEGGPGFRLFATPHRPINFIEHAIGLNAANLVEDGGTLQIGIGAMGEAIAYSLRLRHMDNEAYRAAFEALHPEGQAGGIFEDGLYGSSEMFVDGFWHLMKAGVIKRKVYDDVVLQRLLNDGKISEQVSGETLRALRQADAISAVLTRADFSYLQKYGVFRPEVGFDDGVLTLPDGRTVDADLDRSDNLDEICSTCLGERLKGGVFLHGGFFLGPSDFYQGLRDLTGAQQDAIRMTAISFVNQLYGDEELKRLQRVKARFINSCMMVTLSGAVVSDGLEDGRVVSGVGGQYNFVAMAHELEGGRSIILVNATRTKDGKVSSNIVPHYGHITVPRHLRDIMVSEYGVADLRGKTDRDVVVALVEIADSRFQDELIAVAKKAGKLEAGYVLPPACRNNLPARLAAALKPVQAAGHFSSFPFGSDLTSEERALAGALRRLKAAMSHPVRAAGLVMGALFAPKPSARWTAHLERMGLAQPSGLKERVTQQLLVRMLAGG